MHYIIMFLVLGTMYYMNYLGANTSQLGISIMDLANIFPFSFMPPGWTFMVAWATIFVMVWIYLIVSFIRYIKTKQDDRAALRLFLATCVVNILRLIVVGRGWHVVSVILIFLLMILLWRLLDHYKNNKKSIWWATFGLYFGWISIASMVIGISQVLYTYFPNIALSTGWAYIALCIGIITTIYSWLRWKNPYALAMSIWALIWACVTMFGR